MNKLIFGDVEVIKQGIKLKDIILKNIVVSNNVKMNDKTVKYFIGYIVGDNVVPLILLLPVMSG